MYDHFVKLDYHFWRNYRDLKIINFSKTINDKLAKWGFESIYIRYFPKPDEFVAGNKNEIFFWQRVTNININSITRLLGENNFKIHIHKAIDPGQQFIQPSSEDEKKFNITYSDWFETKEKLWDLIKQKSVYIASREFEGIGLSFLEAMAMGKVVIAINNPTMNEYIENNKTGYLVNLNSAAKIDFFNIDEIQKNAYEFMKKGYKKYEEEKIRIIDFIKKD